MSRHTIRTGPLPPDSISGPHKVVCHWPRFRNTSGSVCVLVWVWMAKWQFSDKTVTVSEKSVKWHGLYPNLMNGNLATVSSLNYHSAIQTQTQTELEAYRMHHCVFEIPLAWMGNQLSKSNDIHWWLCIWSEPQQTLYISIKNCMCFTFPKLHQ